MKIEFSPSAEQIRLLVIAALILLGLTHDDILLLVGL